MIFKLINSQSDFCFESISNGTKAVLVMVFIHVPCRSLNKFFLLVELRLFFVVQIEITNLKHNFFIMWFSLLNYIELVLIKDVWCHINIS